MFYKIVEISNLASVNGRSTGGMVYVLVQFGETLLDAENNPSVVEDFIMQVPPRLIVEGVDVGESPAETIVVENIERHVPRIQAQGLVGDRTHPRVVRDARDPLGIIQRPAVQQLIGATLAV